MEIIIATYGEADANHNILTRQAAVLMAQQAKGKAIAGLNGYHVTNTRVEGDEMQGKIVAICEPVSTTDSE